MARVKRICKVGQGIEELATAGILGLQGIIGAIRSSRRTFRTFRLFRGRNQNTETLAESRGRKPLHLSCPSDCLPLSFLGQFSSKLAGKENG